MGEEKVSITRGNLLTIAIVVAVVVVAIGAFAVATAPQSSQSQSTGLATAQPQGTQNSGATGSKGLAALPNMVGGC